ncbi:unannotated protein [freshwater metagenome]|uniref:Unannotated protein n=1 Tax=freshwater metagenome TaxID=449393 RepID=A0A6J6S1U1_9ZZZZ
MVGIITGSTRTLSRFNAVESTIAVTVSTGFEVDPTTQKYPDLSLAIAVAISSLLVPRRKSQIRTLFLSKIEMNPSLPPRFGVVTKLAKPLSTVPTIAIAVVLTVKSEI